MKLNGGVAAACQLERGTDSATMAILQLPQQYYFNQPYPLGYCDQQPHHQHTAMATEAGAAMGRQYAPENKQQCSHPIQTHKVSTVSGSRSGLADGASPPSRYESQKRRDWNTFGHYLRNHRPPLALAKCSGAHVLEFLKYLDQFGKTKVHATGCPFFGHPNPPAPCTCPLRQAWGSLDALIGRLRAAFEAHGGRAESNPFGTRAVRLYLREVRETQAKARGIAYEKRKKKSTARLCAAPTTSALIQSSVPCSGATTGSNLPILLNPDHHGSLYHASSPPLQGTPLPPTNDVIQGSPAATIASTATSSVMAFSWNPQYTQPVFQQRPQPPM